MLKQFDKFIVDYDQQISKDADGNVARFTNDFKAVASLKILDDLRRRGLENLPEAEPQETLHERLARWVLDASPAQRELADLALPIPPTGVHFVPGRLPVYYDFKNTDIALDELQKAGVAIRGRLLDFGCSSGRNLATLRRAYPDELELFGADPAGPSIDWLNANIPGVQAVKSTQAPPLPYADASFDVIIAKSIWTHFSPKAGREWFSEMRRIMAPGAHFMFSTHGPHDVAYRIVYDMPKINYDDIAGHDNWTREAFLLDIITNLDSANYYFQPHKSASNHGDMKLVEGAVTDDWGLIFMTEDYLRSMLPDGFTVVNRSIGRTGNRHDVYVVRRD